MASVVQPLSSAQNPGFTLQQFVQSQPTPLVCIQFGAQWCGPCKQMAPLYESLAQSVAGKIACFKVDVDESEDIAVAADVTDLPTFKFYTTKLSPNQELQQVEQVKGADQNALKINFSKGGQIAAAFLAQQPAAQQSSPPAQTAQQSLPPAQVGQVQHAPQGGQVGQAPQPPVHQSLPPAQQGPVGGQPSPPVQPAGPNQVVKQELIEIRAALVAALQRTERLYSALQ